MCAFWMLEMNAVNGIIVASVPISWFEANNGFSKQCCRVQAGSRYIFCCPRMFAGLPRPILIEGEV